MVIGVPKVPGADSPYRLPSLQEPAAEGEKVSREQQTDSPETAPGPDVSESQPPPEESGPASSEQ